jgi:hypothetical protein
VWRWDGAQVATESYGEVQPPAVVGDRSNGIAIREVATGRQQWLLRALETVNLLGMLRRTSASTTWSKWSTRAATAAITPAAASQSMRRIRFIRLRSRHASPVREPESRLGDALP